MTLIDQPLPPALAKILDKNYQYDGADFGLGHLEVGDDAGAGEEQNTVKKAPILSRIKRKSSARQWRQVPVTKMYGHRYSMAETTLNHKYIRVGIHRPSCIKERLATKIHHGFVYSFELGNFRDNTIPKKAFVRCPPLSPGHAADCKGRAELKACFINDQAPQLSARDRAFRIAARSFENDCDAKIPHGSTYAKSMEVMIKVPGKMIIEQLHGMPDRELYERDGRLYQVPGSSTEATYRAVRSESENRFETGGYPSFTIAIEKEGLNYFLVVQARSDKAVFTDLKKRCNKKFIAAFDQLNQATCCHNERDVTYVYFAKVGTDVPASDWTRFDFEVKTTNFSAADIQPGYVKLWKDGVMVAHSILYIGRNDDPMRGGSGLYDKFGIYRPNSEDPVAVQFRSVKTGKVIAGVVQGLNTTLLPAYVEGTCIPLPVSTTTELPTTTEPLTTIEPSTTTEPLTTIESSTTTDQPAITQTTSAWDYSHIALTSCLFLTSVASICLNFGNSYRIRNLTRELERRNQTHEMLEVRRPMVEEIT